MYNFLIILGFLAYLPKIFYKTFTQKGYKYPFLERFGGRIPEIPKEGRVYLFHANSLGETKAALVFAQYLKGQIKDAVIVFSSVTETGKEAAEKSPLVDLSIYMPLDLSFVMRYFVRELNPETVFIVETDFWWQFFKEVKKAKKNLYIISGKISSRSATRFRKVPFFSKKLFSSVDLFCLQNSTFKQAFCSLGIPKERVVVTGNLKFDQKPRSFTPQELEDFRKRLKISPDDRVLTIASTHEPEEKKLIQRLEGAGYKILLAPRHPYRFDRIYDDLSKTNMNIGRLSNLQTLTSQTEVILIDAMCLVPLLFCLSQVAIIGGSFINKVGGHNVLEPILYDIPTLFGPYMHAQKDLVTYVLETGRAKKTTLDSLLDDLKRMAQTEKCPSINTDAVCKKTWEKIFSC